MLPRPICARPKWPTGGGHLGKSAKTNHKWPNFVIGLVSDCEIDIVIDRWAQRALWAQKGSCTGDGTVRWPQRALQVTVNTSTLEIKIQQRIDFFLIQYLTKWPLEIITHM